MSEIEDIDFKIFDTFCSFASIYNKFCLTLSGLIAFLMFFDTNVYDWPDEIYVSKIY